MSQVVLPWARVFRKATSQRPRRRISSAQATYFVALIFAAATSAAACNLDMHLSGDGATDGADLDGSLGGTGGEYAPGGGSGGFGGTDETGGAPSAGGGAGEGGGGSSGDAWLDQQGVACEPTTAAPSELPSEPTTDCEFFEIGLPGVIEYTVDPSGLELDWIGAGGLYEYVGCDQADSPCIGRIEYAWEVEYLADNEWYVSITPQHPECDYDHVLWQNLPSGELQAHAVIVWSPVELTLHLQPTPAGLTVGAVRSASDEMLEAGAFTSMPKNNGWPGEEFSALFDEAFVEHLKSIEWECAQ